MSVTPPNLEELLAPLLASLPSATISSEPPTALLPLLSPILRQRVQILSSSSSDPWISLLCYDEGNIPKLKAIASSPLFEPHPVSGQVEVDWESECQIQFKCIDAETLQALVVLQELELVVKLVWCINDTAEISGSSNGWRIGEVEPYNAELQAWGAQSLLRAEELFQLIGIHDREVADAGKATLGQAPTAEIEADEDNYWAQYGQTLSQSDVDRVPVNSQRDNLPDSGDQDETYYAQYANIQPALDNSVPDEGESLGVVEGRLSPPHPVRRPYLSRKSTPTRAHENTQNNAAASLVDSVMSYKIPPAQRSRPASNTSLHRTSTFGDLSRPAFSRCSSESAVKLHISTSLRSLFALAHATGLGGELSQLVRSELDALTKAEGAEESQIEVKEEQNKGNPIILRGDAHFQSKRGEN